MAFACQHDGGHRSNWFGRVPRHAFSAAASSSMHAAAEGPAIFAVYDAMPRFDTPARQRCAAIIIKVKLTAYAHTASFCATLLDYPAKVFIAITSHYIDKAEISGSLPEKQAIATPASGFGHERCDRYASTGMAKSTIQARQSSALPQKMPPPAFHQHADAYCCTS